MGGAPLGEVEEDFAATLTPGDTFLIGGEVVRYESLRELTVEAKVRTFKSMIVIREVVGFDPARTHLAGGS